MKLYLAPLEGITGFVFRNNISKNFGGVDKYFTPFIVPCVLKKSANKILRDLDSANNSSIKLVPQIMTNNAEDFLSLEEKLNELGYFELNLNLGCPSGTVVAKGRGAGFLKDTEKLDSFLEEIFKYTKGKISLKTRLGLNAPEEFEEILEVYNKYEMEELIIHPRVRAEFYKSSPHMESFIYALEHSKNRLCYNGEVRSLEDYGNILNSVSEAPDKDKLHAVMIGRAAVGDPSIFRQIRGGNTASKEELLNYLTTQEAGLKEYMKEDRPVLFHMKEIWSYINMMNDCDPKLYKHILKSKTLGEYRIAVRKILL